MSASAAIFALPAPRETWIAYDEALRFCNRTMQWMSGQVRAGAIRQREIARTLGNGRLARQIELGSLPAEAQRRYAAELEKAIPQFQQPLLPLLDRPQLVRNALRVRATPAHLSEAQQRHRVLEPIVAMQDKEVRQTYGDTLRLADGTPVNSQNRMITYQIEQAALRGEALSRRTILRWLKRYREQPGVAGLAKRPRKDAGRSRYFSLPEHQAAAALVAYLYLGDGMAPGLSVQACYDMLRVQRELVGLPEKELPHYDTVRVFLARITPALKVFARRGRKEFAERMLPYISRGYLLDRPARSVYVTAHKLGLRKSRECIVAVARELSARPDHGGRTTRFVKGQVPPNKGRKMPGWAPGRMRETQFKKGVRSGKAAMNWMPVGSTRKIEGYLYRKVSDVANVPYTHNWKPEHVLLWETKRGPVPAGHVVIFKDGNPDRIRISNLEMLSRAELMNRNSIHRLPPELKELIHLSGVIKSVITKRRKKHAKEQDGRPA